MKGTRRETRAALKSPGEFGDAGARDTEGRETLCAHSSSLKTALRHVHFLRSEPKTLLPNSEGMPDSMSEPVRKANV